MITYRATEREDKLGAETTVLYEGQSYFEAQDAYEQRLRYLRIHGPLTNLAIHVTYIRKDGGPTTTSLEFCQVDSLRHGLALVTERE